MTMISIRYPLKGRCLSGFTLVELLTVLGIVAVLAGILIPVVSKMRERARSVECLNNLRTIGVAMHLYANDNKGCLPIVSSSSSNWVYLLTGRGTGADYVSSQGVITSIASGRDSVFICKENVATATGNVGKAVAQTYGMNYNLGGKSLNAVSSPSRTCLAGDNICNVSSWQLLMRPDRPVAVPANVHNGLYHFVYVDGHVAAPSVYPASKSDPFWSP